MKSVRILVFSLDIAWLAMALALSYGLRYRHAEPGDPVYSFLLFVGVGIWALLYTTMSLDCFDGGWRFYVAVGKMLRATIVLVTLILAGAYLARLYYSRLLLIYFGAFLIVGFILVRVAVYLLLRTRYRRGHAKKVVLVGNERFAREFAFKIERHPELLYQVVGTLCPIGTGASSATHGEILGSVEVLRSLSERQVEELIVLQEEPQGLEFQGFIARCRAKGMRVNVLPRGYELYTSRPKLIEIDGLPLILLESRDIMSGSAAVKRGMDIALVILLLLPAALILVFCAPVLLAHRRKLLKRELRVGQFGRSFWMYRLNVDRESECVPAYERFIRDLSISEIPQLWNVLIGDMSMVGPRPEDPERVRRYSEWQKERLKVKPGVTGLAQVNGLREHHGSEDKARFDLQYLLEWSPLNDLVLIVQTLVTLISRLFSRNRLVRDERGDRYVCRATVSH